MTGYGHVFGKVDTHTFASVHEVYESVGRMKLLAALEHFYFDAFNVCVILLWEQVVRIAFTLRSGMHCAECTQALFTKIDI